MEQLRSAHVRLLAVTDQGWANEKEVRTLAAAEARMLSKLLIENSSMQARLYRVLTREQRRKLDDLRAFTEP